MNRPSRVIPAAVATSVVTAVLIPTGASATPAAPATAPAHATAAQRHEVTLVTGDRVLAARDATGRWSLGLAQDPDRAPGAAEHVVTYGKRRGGVVDHYLVPDKALGLLRAGVLDEQLFNITGLIRQGYDDATTDSLPLLIERPDGASARAVAEAPAGSTVDRALPELGLTAVAEHKNRAEEFFAGVAPSPTALVASTREVWLNARVTASLDRSVPQIGAPEAWAAGYTGKGVTVAVLDTGYDDRHPDLAGTVTRSRDFSGADGGSVRDGHGHGTHVASTITGSGAASGGRYRGVAPDASLAVGKVLGDDGSGELDDVSAGMAWAAAEAHADVVNMSVGSWPTDGTDPAARALNELSVRYGTLFVVAAGNYGSDEAVSSPASADAALAVAGLTKDGKLSEFSSRGPRVGDGAAKPEIAAPGSDIVAARAAGTSIGSPVDTSYTSLSGTSMATPHVAGAAAIVAQQHPDWSGDRFKGALVGTAAPVAGTGATAVDAGLVDLARATKQPVRTDQASVSTYLRWPTPQPQERKVAYRNDTDSPVPLHLALALTDKTGQQAPARLAELSAPTLTVPARGAADAVITTRGGSGKAGIAFNGLLTARAADGAVSLRTPVGVQEEPERYDLAIDVKNRDGATPNPDDGSVLAVNVETGEAISSPLGQPLRVAPGTYTVSGYVQTPTPNKVAVVASFANPDVRVTGAARVAFDARLGKRVSFDVGQPAARGGAWLSLAQTTTKGLPYPVSAALYLDPQFNELYAYSTPGVRAPWFGYAENARLEEPLLELFAESPQRFEVVSSWLRGSPDPKLDERLDAVHAGAGTPEDLARVDVRGKLAVIELPDGITYEEVYRRVEGIKNAGGKLVAAYVAERAALAGAALSPETPLAALPTLRVGDVPGRRFVAAVKAGGVKTSLLSRKVSASRYELSYPTEGYVPARLEHRERQSDLAAVRTIHYDGTENTPYITAAEVDGLGTTIGTNRGLIAPWAAERTEYFTPGKWTLRGYVWSALAGDMVEQLDLKGGRTYRVEWGKGVRGPGFTGTTLDDFGKPRPWVSRTGDRLRVDVPFFTDAAGHAVGAQTWADMETGTTALYRDGVQLGKVDKPGVAELAAPADNSTYRLTADVDRAPQQDWWKLSTKVAVDWTYRFPPRGGPDEVPPLLTVGYRPALSLTNSAPAGRFTIPVTVGRADAPRPQVRSLTVEVSYDDGATWQPTQTRRADPGWEVSVRNPATGHASPRARATDNAGNSVTQTVIRAYRIG
ncbi:S8 family serine peptidase [Actinokineospora auranticolor]|uniref:Subtilisin family serine protease n=1 Tax=Actinokineospora auranticolor TaxID=155976 RepID=A0A2S6GCQ4_9PSEU|nr:S8 family serine peptidase [Actinokineospora auranticolor]PPK62060.1 subtilisin family serine protease [Actinokineospora auranticolor]